MPFWEVHLARLPAGLPRGATEQDFSGAAACSRSANNHASIVARDTGATLGRLATASHGHDACAAHAFVEAVPG
ncbi:hypothetical protein ACWHLZ_43560 [Streptomyces chartreusis]|uniref:hypothetical protein n=1 Tax=Streptomyces chartreusis TaxID=1969 RepID=UPI0033E91730|nr:hypothetical protein OIA45_24620 [Streptomyces chartreusis]